MPVRMILDEDSRDSLLWAAIQRCVSAYALLSVDIIRVGDHGGPSCGIKDPELLEWANTDGRTVVTQDVNTMIAYHQNIVLNGRPTTGLIVLKSGFPHAVVAEEITLIAECSEPYEIASQVKFIPSVSTKS